MSVEIGRWYLGKDLFKGGRFTQSAQGVASDLATAKAAALDALGIDPRTVRDA